MTASVEISDLNVWYPGEYEESVHAVRGVDLTVQAGESVGLVGESGSGKTTTMMAMARLLESSATVSGSVRIAGEEFLTLPERAVREHRWRELAVVFQGAMNSLSPVRRVGQQISDAMKLHGVAHGREAQRRTNELLTQVGVPTSAATRFPHELSGGMRQRVAIAMALGCEPRVLIADEPTTALDVMVQAQVLQLLRELATTRGLTFMLVSHDLSLVSEVCDRILVMYGGQIVEDAPRDQLFSSPRHPYTRLLLEATPDIDDPRIPTSIPGSPPRLDLPVVGCAFKDRCPIAVPECAEKEPALVELDQGSARCHRLDVLA